MTTFSHLFGPVSSRRYGRSLGVDLAVPKTCTLNKKATKAVYVASATEKGKFILATVTATNVLGSISWISASTNALK